jgi:DNA-binding MarR family transcriptional regulator
MSEPDLYQLIERIGNLLRTEVRKTGGSFGLQPVHLQALYYLSQCNRYSDTPAAVTDYLGTTKGTVSQSLQVLEKKGYIDKKTDTRDRRVQHLTVSERGQRVLMEILPPPVFREAASRVSERDHTEAVRLLTRLLTELQRSNRSKTFGVCNSCGFFRSDGQSHHCGLTQETLSDSDIEKICREHEPRGNGVTQ